jgi:uncharacterized protein (DUF2147 family)
MRKHGSFYLFSRKNHPMRAVYLLLFVTFGHLAPAQDVKGKWKTIDDETQEPKSIVEIFERDGKLFGKIVKLFRKPGEDQDPVCDECDEDDPRYLKKIIGMEIMREMVPAEGEYSGGDILDPNKGKVYSCKIWIEGKDLKVRGYWGPFYRTQTWLRAQ